MDWWVYFIILKHISGSSLFIQLIADSYKDIFKFLLKNHSILEMKSWTGPANFELDFSVAVTHGFFLNMFKTNHTFVPLQPSNVFSLFRFATISGSVFWSNAYGIMY